MKKQLLALATLAAVSGVAVAQNATFYGVLDANITNDTKSNTTSFGEGGLTPNIWGVRGSEDLGGGLKAGFNLEGHFSPATGARGVNGYTAAGTVGTLANLNTNLFSRAANVSLSNDLGTIRLGNGLSTSVLAYASTDPRGLRESMSGLGFILNMTSITSSATNSVAAPGIGMVFLNNAVQATTKVGGVDLGASYIVGGASNDTSKASGYDLSATTTVNGLSLSAGYNQQKQASSVNVDFQVVHAGLAYQIGALRLAANNLTVKSNTYNTGNVGQRNSVWGFGGNYQVNGATSVNAALYSNRDSSGAKSSSNIVVGVEYGLSKRTTTYAQAAFINGASTWGATAPAAATSTNLTQVGLRHTF